MVIARWRELVVVAAFLAMIAAQWRVYGAIPGPDAIAYITAGVTLVTTGTLTDAAGESQLWFPPFYPLLIGVFSGGGAIDPVMVGRVVSTSMAVLGLLLAGHITRSMLSPGTRRYEPALAMTILAANPIYQHSALAALSEATATTLALAAFAIWLRLPERDSAVRYAAIGALIGLSYLSRPEGLVLLPLWALVDVWRMGMTRPLVRGYAIAAGAALVVALPYLLYLYQHTGGVALTGKTEINLASGRATYLRLPREYIDPATLEMGFWPYNVTAVGEVGRYFWNLARILAESLRNQGALIVVPVLAGLGAYFSGKRWRFLAGAACFFAYLFVLAAFEVKNRYLHVTLPCLSILAARGVARLLELPRRRPWWALTPATLAVALMVGVVGQGVKAMRENMIDRSGFALLRDAGQRLAGSRSSPCVVYERFGMLGYYGHCATRTLTSNDVPTILRYIDRHEPPGTAVYIGVSSLESYGYHPSVSLLLNAADTSPRLQPLFAVSDAGHRAVVYRVRTASGPVMPAP